LIPHDQRRARPGWQQPAPQIGAVGRNRIADDLLFELARQIELDAPRHVIVARKRDMQAPRSPPNAPALDQQRGKHDHECNVEIDFGFRKVHEQGDRRQKIQQRRAAGPTR
jgi:hypothetical protein